MRRGSLRFAAVAGFAVFLVGTGTVAGHAFWTAETSKTIPFSTATVSATSAGTDALATKYTAGISGIFSPSLTHTAPVTVTNTGTSPLSFSMTVAGGTAALNAAIEVQVWKQNGTCTDVTIADTATSTTGRLSAPPALNSTIASVPAGGSIAYCLRTTLTGTFPAVEQTTTPSLSFTGTVGNNWTTSTIAIPFAQQTAFDWFQIVQSSTTTCLRTSATAPAATGQDIVNGACTAPIPTNNQAFRLFASTGGYYRLYPGTGTATGPAVSGAPATFFGIIPSVVELTTVTTGNSAAALRTQWLPVAHGTAGDFQIVNREAGLCLTMPSATAGTTATITACTTSTTPGSTAYRNQHFQLTAIP